jgi:hypothetical protein
MRRSILQGCGPSVLVTDERESPDLSAGPLLVPLVSFCDCLRDTNFRVVKFDFTSKAEDNFSWRVISSPTHECLAYRIGAIRNRLCLPPSPRLLLSK